MEVVTDMIDQVSYECGESSGYIDGSKDGYEYGYHDCILDLIKRATILLELGKERFVSFYILLNRSCGGWHCCSSLF